MKLNRIILSAILLAMLPVSAFSDDLGMARIGLVNGDVQISTADTKEWVPASINTPLQQGDRIWVPEGGRSEVRISGGVSARLDAVTSFDILTLGDNSLQFFLNGGRAYINNRKQVIDIIQVDTPLSSITCYGSSIAMLDVYEDGTTDVSVTRGYAYVETRNGKTRVTSGNTLRIGPDLTADIFPINTPDEWVTWNRNRDRRLAGRPEYQRYLPSELGDYASDLDQNGRWIETPDYGYVWTPMVSVSADWAPYREGKWAWMNGDYVWVSYESWGWAPYHYGRWAFIPRSGWCWVPPRRGQAHWAPGYVAWVHTPSYVSWVPLAPGETYYSRRNYGPGSVSITNITINNININRQFRNIGINNAVTVLPRDNFISGRKAAFKIRENPFTQRNAGFGPPVIKPSIATMSPRIKTIPTVKLPPPQVRRINVDNLRNERKLVPNERGSVFAPGRQVPVIGAVPHKEPIRIKPGLKPGQFSGTRLQPGPKGISPIAPPATRVQPLERPVIKKPERTFKGPAAGPPTVTVPGTPPSSFKPGAAGSRERELRPLTPGGDQGRFRRSPLPATQTPPPVTQERTFKKPAPAMVAPPAVSQPVAPAPVRRAPKIEPPQVQQPPVRTTPRFKAPPAPATQVKPPTVQQPPVRQLRQYQPPASQPQAPPPVAQPPVRHTPKFQAPPVSKPPTPPPVAQPPVRPTPRFQAPPVQAPAAPQPPARQFRQYQPPVSKPPTPPPVAQPPARPAPRFQAPPVQAPPAPPPVRQFHPAPPPAQQPPAVNPEKLLKKKLPPTEQPPAGGPPAAGPR